MVPHHEHFTSHYHLHLLTATFQPIQPSNNHPFIAQSGNTIHTVKKGRTLPSRYSNFLSKKQKEVTSSVVDIHFEHYTHVNLKQRVEYRAGSLLLEVEKESLRASEDSDDAIRVMANVCAYFQGVWPGLSCSDAERFYRLTSDPISSCPQAVCRMFMKRV
jgi:hypothetical protein